MSDTSIDITCNPNQPLHYCTGCLTYTTREHHCIGDEHNNENPHNEWACACGSTAFYVTAYHSSRGHGSIDDDGYLPIHFDDDNDTEYSNVLCSECGAHADLDWDLV